MSDIAASDDPKEWFLLETAATRAQDAARLCNAAGIDAFSPQGAQGQMIFPRHIFIALTATQTQPPILRDHLPRARLVTNEYNRPLSVPGNIAAVLRNPDSEAGQSLRNLLAAMAPEYRTERLQIAFTQMRSDRSGESLSF